MLSAARLRTLPSGRGLTRNAAVCTPDLESFSVTTEPFPDKPASVAVQSVLYNNSLPSLIKALEALDNSALVGKRELMASRVVSVLGDASGAPLLDEPTLASLREQFSNLDEIVYVYFGENSGTSRGHNRLAELADTDFIVTSNPDVIADARALWRMVAAFNDPTVGMVEAKQLPVEHPKDYAAHTGATGWATTAFAMTRRSLFEQLEGFDAQTFFMYCDDVDYSWRVREAGYTVVFHAAAIVFHDKQLTARGKWMATGAEHFYSAQASLLLAHKWSRDDEVDRILAIFEESERDEQRAAAAEFKERRDAGLLVAQRDADGQVGEFVGNFYTEHRYGL